MPAGNRRISVKRREPYDDQSDKPRLAQHDIGPHSVKCLFNLDYQHNQGDQKIKEIPSLSGVVSIETAAI